MSLNYYREIEARYQARLATPEGQARLERARKRHEAKFRTLSRPRKTTATRPNSLLG